MLHDAAFGFSFSLSFDFLNAMIDRDSLRKHTLQFSILIIVSTIFLSYANTFHASWHFDDFDNIPDHQALHIQDLSLGTLFNTFFANPETPNQKSFYRPISNLSFALNWYWGGGGVWGYHLVNITLHCLTSVFLFLTILQIYSTPYLRSTDKQIAGGIAFLATLLWALNPIQTQAVTYIVQRMATLAAMFYIMAVYFYFKLRQATTSGNKWIFFFCILFCTLLAIGSKENAATAPVSFLLSEILFFRKTPSFIIRKSTYLFFICTGFALIIVGLVFLKGDLLSFLDGYQSRSFTLAERLLTEPRIVTIYLSQLFYPAVFRFSLEHDIILSKNLLSPWTTIPAILFIFALVSSSLVFHKKYPLFSFSILFYFLNQLIESTFLPLELFFEHRNYLPSLFLFVPVADIIVRKITEAQQTNPARFRIFTFSTLALMLTFGTGTFVRNMVWESEQTLWQDAVKKAPNNARALNNLANFYAAAKLYDQALLLYTRSLQWSDTAPTPQDAKVWALNGLGSVYMLTDRPEEAIPILEKALKISPAYKLARLNLSLSLLSLHKWRDLQKNVHILLASDKTNADYLYLDNIVKIGLAIEEKTAVEPLNDLTNLDPSNKNLRLLLAISHKGLKNYPESLKYLTEYDMIIAGNLSAKLALLDIYSLQNNVLAENQLAKEIITHFTSNGINAALKASSIMGMKIFSPEEMQRIITSSQKSNSSISLQDEETPL